MLNEQHDLTPKIDRPQSDIQEIISNLSKLLAIAKEERDYANDLHNTLFGTNTARDGMRAEESPEPEGAFSLIQTLITKISIIQGETINILGTLRSRCMR